MGTQTICFYLTATHLGGAERSILDLASKLHTMSAGKFEPWILLPRSEGDLIQEIQNRRLPYSILEMPKGFLKTTQKEGLLTNWALMKILPELSMYSFKFAQLLREKQVGLIHCNGFKPQILATLTQYFHRKPVLWHLRDIIRPGVFTQMINLLAQNSRVFSIANSKATAQSLPRGKARLRVVHNGIPFHQCVEKNHREFQKQLKMDPAVPIVGFMAGLAQWKGPFEFLEMAKEILSRGKKLGFVLVGGEVFDTGSEKGILKQLKEKAKAMGLEEKVLFTGQIRDPIWALNGMDILVHCSNRPEPFGRVVVEAMALGKPVVAAGAGGILEILENEKTGLLFPPGDVLAMASQVEKLLDQPELLQKLARSGQVRAQKVFSLEKHVQGVLDFYQEILAS